MSAELAGLPEGGPAQLELAKTWLSIELADETDDETLTLVVATVNRQVRSWRIAQDAVDAETWPPHIVQGATMLAARLFRRRNSPAGVMPFGQDGAAYVSRNDPDIGSLLGLGASQPPTVG